jgi:hypothetical protein
MIMLIILLILIFGRGDTWPPVVPGGAGIGLGTILVILLIAYLLGLFR